MSDSHAPNNPADAPTTSAALAAQARLRGDAVACRYRASGRWRSTTWHQLYRDARALAKRLASWGVEPGDHVAILARTRFEWLLADAAIAMSGAITLALPGDMAPERLLEVQARYEVGVWFVDGPTELVHLLDERGGARPGVEHLVYFDARSTVTGRDTPLMLDEVAGWPPSDAIVSLEELLDTPADDATWGALNERVVEPDAVATIAWSAGTTDTHRPVPLTHRNLLVAAGALARALELTHDDLVLVALPLCNVQGRVFWLSALITGHAVAMGRGLPRLIDDAGELEPTFVASMPLVFEKLSSRILSDVQASSPLRRAVFGWAIDTGREVSQAHQRRSGIGRLLGLKQAVADRFVFRRLHALLGGRLRAFISAGGALPTESAEFFHAAGVLVLEGYGLTECAGLVHVNRLDDFRFGTAGRALPGMSTRIDPQSGRIEIRSASVSVAADDLEWTDDGWLRTEDLGTIDDAGFLDFEARISEMLTLSSGERTNPTMAEQRLRVEPIVSQVVAFGHDRPFLSALVTLDEDTLRRWAGEHGLAPVDATSGQAMPADSLSLSELTQSQSAYQLVERLVALHNSELSPAQQVRKFALLESDLTIERGELTTLLEVRRQVVYEHYGPILESFYADEY